MNSAVKILIDQLYVFPNSAPLKITRIEIDLQSEEILVFKKNRGAKNSKDVFEIEGEDFWRRLI